MKEFEELYFGQGLYIGLSGSMFYPPKLAEHYTEPEQQLFLNLLEFRRVVAVLKKLNEKDSSIAGNISRKQAMFSLEFN